MSKTYHNTTVAVTARPRSKRLREAGGYYTALTVANNAGSNAGQTVVEGSSNLFEEVLDSNSNVIGIKPLYDLHIIQTPADEDNGVDEVLKNICAILRHLRVEESGENLVLISDITLASERNIVAGGIGSSSGGGTGGCLSTLADVALANLADGDIIRYDATSSHWINSTLTLGILSDIQLGTPADGQALIYDAALGKWRPGTVAAGGGIGSVALAMPTGFTVTGSPLTSDGTLDVSFASGYSLPTTSKQVQWDTAYGWGNHASAGYITQASADGRYGAGFNIANNRLYIVNKNGTSLDYVTGSDLVTALGTNAVARATNDASGNTIASQSWVENKGYLTSLAFSGLTSHPTTISGYGITDAKITNGTITLGGNSLTPLTSLSFGGLSEHPTTLAGYGITDAKISRGVITLGSNTITPLTDISVVSGDNTIGTSLTTIGQVHGVNIRAKIAAYLLESDFTAANIVATLGSTPVNRATADASGNIITSSYLRKDTDDTMAGNLTVGQANTSGSKTLAIYGRNNATTPALIIYGVASASTRYATSIYRDASALQITSTVAISGNLTATGNLVAGAASDRRLKKDIRSIRLDEAAEMLSALKPVIFEWNSLAGDLGQLSGVSRGFLADEYLKCMPNTGRKIWGEYDAIDYLQTIPYLVSGWQRQNLQIRILESEIKTIKEEMKILRRRLRGYEP